MTIRKLIICLCLVPSFLYSQSKYEADFEEFLNDYETHCAYLTDQMFDFEKIREIYKPKLVSIKKKNDFIAFLEEVINEFHNGHISLNTNLKNSNNIIPSGSDIFAMKIRDKFIIQDVRKGFGAELSGLKSGMEIVKFNNQSIDEVIKKFLPKTHEFHNDAMYEYALNMLLAGERGKERKITILENGKNKNYSLNEFEYKKDRALLSVEKMDVDIGYIKINNSLGNSDLIPAFDAAIDSLLDAKTIILDLTETPSGGNTMIARAILGRFIEKEEAYQIHQYTEQPYGTIRKWIELASPREKRFKGELLVLVGRWTGSMGEGIAIGFHGMKRAEVIGTKMAGLIGAIEIFEMTESKIGYSIPTERMYLVNGWPRELYQPAHLTENFQETFEKAMELAKE